jgi:hypothetical protein
LGGRFLRAARLSFLRSALSLIFLVFIGLVTAPLLAGLSNRKPHHRAQRGHREKHLAGRDAAFSVTSVASVVKFFRYAFSKPAYCAINFFWP